ncbi:hypothetical protein WL1483_255 [Aeromonas schubertii]|uniref:Uncharacterized protein n=1 Tax=Aeromonas schubertii TaxID=652 RepID=A0A0S2SD96_9GAMM|nr:hypothetical protein WL1483_255 [Aeromonas schubertii]
MAPSRITGGLPAGSHLGGAEHQGHQAKCRFAPGEKVHVLQSDAPQAVAGQGRQTAPGLLAAGKHHQQILAEAGKLRRHVAPRPLPQGREQQHRGDAQAHRRDQGQGAAAMAQQGGGGEGDGVVP